MTRQAGVAASVMVTVVLGAALIGTPASRRSNNVGSREAERVVARTPRA
jgi:hypothetical protein